MIWKEELSLPRGVGGHAVGVVADDLIVAGGTYWHDDVMHYSDACQTLGSAGEWSQSGPMPVALAYGARLTHRNCLYVVGGSSCGNMQRESYRLDGTSRQWELLAASPQELVLAGMAASGARGWLVGGSRSQTDLSQVSTSLWSIDLNSNSSQWTSEKAFPGAPRAMAATVSVNDKLYLFAGVTGLGSGGIQNHNDAWSFDMQTGSWQRVRDFPTAIRGMAAVVAEDRFVILLGGAEQRNGTFAFSAAVTVYDTQTDQYFQTHPMPLAAGVMDAVIRDGRVFVMGGEDKAKSRNARMISANVPSLLNVPRVSVQVLKPAELISPTSEKA